MNFFALAYTAVLICDRLLKWLVLSTLRPGVPVAVVPFVTLNLTFNTGAAFGLLPNSRWPLVALGLAVSVGAFYVASRLCLISPGDRGLLAGVALVGGGAAGNLIDRVIFGYVIDFVDLQIWPVFNLADSALVVGGLYLAWRSLVWRRAGEG